VTTIIRSDIKPLPGFRSPEAAMFVAQLDDQLRLAKEATRNLSPEDLAWQPAPGMNTIGMLLAHVAITEVGWAKVILGGEPPGSEVDDVLGIRSDGDGMPIADGASAYAPLNGKAFAYYEDLLDRARDHLKRLARERGPEDMDREVRRERSDGSVRVLNVRWFYYFILQHFTGHYGQILLLGHLRRASRERTPR
jgi:DinB family protein